jgi:hypothetical protein
VINNQLVYVSKTMYYVTLIAGIFIYLLLDQLKRPYLYSSGIINAIKRGRAGSTGGRYVIRICTTTQKWFFSPYISSPLRKPI